jgi:hypothetical protein
MIVLTTPPVFHTCTRLKQHCGGCNALVADPANWECRQELARAEILGVTDINRGPGKNVLNVHPFEPGLKLRE